MKKHLIILCLIFITVGCETENSNRVHRETRFIFDTEAYIEIYGDNTEKISNQVLEKIITIDQVSNFHSANSELTKLNKSSGIQPVPLSNELFELIEEALKIAKITGGAVDPTIGPLVKLWESAQEKDALPTKVEIENHLQLVGYDKVIIDDKNRTVYLPIAGMSLDLGAIAKGFAVQKGIQMLKESKVDSAMLRVGGNIYLLGKKQGGSEWSIGIRSPLQPNETLGFIELTNSVIDTAGIYEQQVTIAGKEWGHIIDPRTGYPVRSIVSSTIIADNAPLADGLSTAAVILGVKDSIELLESLSSVKWLLVQTDGTQNMSSGFRSIFNPK